jgi:hypothetical protein
MEWMVMSMSGLKILAFGLTAALASTAASATSFSFNLTNQGNQTATAYNDLTFTSTGAGGASLTMNVYGAHLNTTTTSPGASTYTVSAATVETWSGYGMGVLFGTDTESNGTHQIDNVGSGTDFVVLQFSQAVTLSTFARTAYGITGYSTDSDASYMAYTGTLASLMNGLNPTAFTSAPGGTGSTTTTTGSSVASTIWLVSASVASGDRDDGFKLTTLSVNSIPAAVPEPATWAMMLVGFGAIGGTLRSRRGRETVKVAFGN